jgi:hypothetical protein
MQLATIAPVITPASVAGDLRANQAKGAALTSLRVGSQQRAQTRGAPISQKLGALAIITATRSPTKLVKMLPRNIRQAASTRGSRRSKKAKQHRFQYHSSGQYKHRAGQSDCRHHDLHEWDNRLARQRRLRSECDQQQNQQLESTASELHIHILGSEEDLWTRMFLSVNSW